MKKTCMIIAVAACMTACEKAPDVSELIGAGDQQTEVTKDENGLVQEQKGVTKKFTFTLKGDFSTEWKAVTRTAGYLAADGKDMTDIWVLDYQGGTLVQQLHQNDVTAEDFGKPVLNLAYGSHHVYIIASRGQSPTLNTTNHTISFMKVLDTFYKDYEVDVVSTSNGNRAVTLDRIVTRLRLTFEDAISADAATINFAPHTWYYGWDYIAGTPAGAATDQVTTVTIPSSELGNTGVQANLFGFSTATQWTTDIAINSKKSDNTVIGQATILTAPFKANRISEYAGPLFGTEGVMTLSLSGSWDDAYEGTW